MIIYIKNENGTISTKSTGEITHQLIATARSSEISPYIIGYVPDFSAHFLFTIQQDELRRFGIRSTDVTLFFQTRKAYFPVPAYHVYNKSNQLFSLTPTPGRFTNDRDFTLELRVFLTPEEIKHHCTPKTQTIYVTSVESVQCPYLTDSILTEEQQRILYFNNVIKGCDRFQQTLLTIHENFDDPFKIFTAIITTDSQLSTIGITPDEKKYIEMIFLPFFQPEHINKIEKLGNAFIGDVLDFYFHVIKTELKKINANFNINHEKKYAHNIRNTLIGELSETYSSYGEFWCQPVKSDEDKLAAANDAIFRFIGTIFGITTHDRVDELKILIRSLIQSDNILSQKSHLLQALTDYCNTLSDMENTLHFSPQYQPAYDILSVAYPIPHSQYIQSNILEKLKSAQFILENYDRVNDILHSDKVMLDGMDCVYLLKHFTRQEFTTFFTERQRQISLTLTTIQDIQIIFTHYSQYELNLLLSYFSQEITSLVKNNRGYFYSLLVNHSISLENRCNILSALPIEIARSMLTSLIIDDREAFFDLISSEYAYKITQLLCGIQPEILSRSILNANDFFILFSKLTSEKNLSIYEHLIAMWNAKLCSAGTKAEYFQRAPSELITLLAASHLIYCNYNGKYHEQLNCVLTNIRDNLRMPYSENTKLDIVLSRLKSFSEFDDANRNGRLHNALKAVINAFQNKTEINVAHILELTKGSWWMPSCCTTG